MSIVKNIARDTATGYHPAMMQFNKARYYEKTGLTTSGNKATVALRFNIDPFTTAAGGAAQTLFSIHDSGIDSRIRVFVYASDGADTTRRSKISVNSESGSGTMLCQLFSRSRLADGTDHYLFYSFNADAGTAVFVVDGVNEDDTAQAVRVAPTVGTLDAGGSFTAYIGRFYAGATQLYGGKIGPFGYRDAYLTNWAAFMLGDGTPREINTSTWAEWGAQPLFWNPHGDMMNNLGSAGNMLAYDPTVSPISSGHIPVATS